MPRKPGQPTITIQLSEAQKATLEKLLAGEPQNQYIRRLVAQDARKRGFEWPDDLREWGRTPKN